MIKLESLKSDIQFRRLLAQEKIHTNYFTIYFGKNFPDQKNKNLKRRRLQDPDLGHGGPGAVPGHGAHVLPQRGGGRRLLRRDRPADVPDDADLGRGVKGERRR